MLCLARPKKTSHINAKKKKLALQLGIQIYQILINFISSLFSILLAVLALCIYLAAGKTAHTCNRKFCANAGNLLLISKCRTKKID